MSEDPFEEIMEHFARTMRRIRNEIMSMLYGMSSAEELFEERLKRFEAGILEPLVEVHEVDGEVVIIIDVSGARPETVEVLVGEDAVEVRGEVDERLVSEALSGWYMAHRHRRFQGVYRLPYRIDVSSVRVEKKGSTIVVRARRKA